MEILDIKYLQKLQAEATADLPAYPARATFEGLRAGKLLWGHDDKKVTRVKVTRVGVLPGASLPTIDYRRSDGQRFCSTPGLFYPTREDALAALAAEKATERKYRAKDRLAQEIGEFLPQLLELADKAINQH